MRPLPAGLPALGLALRLPLPLRNRTFLAGVLGSQRRAGRWQPVEQGGRQGVPIRAWWGLRFTARAHRAERGRLSLSIGQAWPRNEDQGADRGLAHSEEPERDGPAVTAVHGESDLYPQRLQGCRPYEFPCSGSPFPRWLKHPLSPTDQKPSHRFLI